MEDDVPVIKLAALTAKQRDVLELLIRHKTSKEIARVLGISPYTVDQRIAAARKKFGVDTRKELAEAYQRLADVSQELIYQSSHVENSAATGEVTGGARLSFRASQTDPYPIQSDKDGETIANYRVVPEIFEGPYGIWVRLISIGAIAIMLLVIVLGGLAAFGQLSDLLR